MERDTNEMSRYGAFFISTHTLTWSVTKYWNKRITYETISTHTLTWSVTFVAGIRVHTHFISTHTLTWSVTCSTHI